ncbi:hypothetical protein [Kribbella italica]|uniref:Uncharacterized protein n=1 Tax=Kribbella italica TaxID=1540520 RepID=A0A7W9MRR4_9ACTN|nr:hypothetical protein [Kribbella italica]MBB5833402.1 hypothetical protein [Kribbella italica]
MEIVIQVCDVCEKVGKPVKQYGVSEDDRVAKPVLCADDAAPLERFLPKAPGGKVVAAARPATKRPAKKAAARGGRQSGVMTMEEIEAQKRKS